MGTAGIRQFLDIGTGIPTSPNVHEIAQGTVPSARVVYVDNDPIVLAHARALMSSGPEGVTAYIDGDMRSPGDILRSPRLREVLDLDRPVGLLLVAALHLIADLDEAYAICRAFVGAMPPGSHVVLTHLTDDLAPEQLRGVSDNYRRRGMTLVPRGKAEIMRFFEGLELVEPGVTILHRWRPELRQPGDLGGAPVSDAEVSLYGGIGRVPDRG